MSPSIQTGADCAPVKLLSQNGNSTLDLLMLPIFGRAWEMRKRLDGFCSHHAPSAVCRRRPCIPSKNKIKCHLLLCWWGKVQQFRRGGLARRDGAWFGWVPIDPITAGGPQTRPRFLTSWLFLTVCPCSISGGGGLQL